MELGNHPEVEELYCSYNGFSSFPLKGLPKLRSVDLGYNSALASLELDENNGINALLISGCAFQSVDDVLECCPSLNELSCSGNRLTELDLTKHLSIRELHCDHNRLTRLLVPEGQYFGHLYCHSNQLGEAALKTLFVSLGQVPKPTPEYPRPPQCRISYSDNPGNKESLKEILKEKNWIVDEE